jgi:hypothetical protein
MYFTDLQNTLLVFQYTYSILFSCYQIFVKNLNLLSIPIILLLWSLSDSNWSQFFGNRRPSTWTTWTRYNICLSMFNEINHSITYAIHIHYYETQNFITYLHTRQYIDYFTPQASTKCDKNMTGGNWIKHAVTDYN